MRAKWSMLFGPEGSIILWPKGSILFGQRGQICLAFPTYEELLSYKVIAQKEDLKRYGVTGWDAGRICFLARACCEMGYISETDAWKYIDIAYNMVHAEFSSWEDMAMSYIIGRSLWGGKGAYNSVMKSTADELLTHVNSPWRKYAW